MTPKVVLDTNILVSAFIKPEGKEALILQLGLAGLFQLCISEAMLAEYEEVLGRPKFKRPPYLVSALIVALRRKALLVYPKRTLKISLHQPDNRFLECAEAAQADFLITGNKRHFPNRWKITRTVSSRELFQLWSLKRK